MFYFFCKERKYRQKGKERIKIYFQWISRNRKEYSRFFKFYEKIDIFSKVKK